MKNKIIKISISLILIIGMVIIPTIGLARVHTTVKSTPKTTTVKSSTPKSSSGIKSNSSVKSSTPKTSTTKSSSTGKTYTTTKDTSNSRTTIKHETVKPKETTVINNNPTYYNNYNTGRSYSITNSIFQYYMLSEIFKDKESVTEKDIVKALEEKGYSKEEVDQILDEAKQEEKINKPFYDGWKWYNWTIFTIIIVACIGLVIWLVWLAFI